MVDKRFYWPEKNTDGSIGSNSDIITLSDSYIKNTLGQFILNPYNRQNAEIVPERIEDIEDNTKREINWDEEKKSWFETAVKEAYQSLLSSDLDGLVEDYFPTDKVSWVEELFLEDMDMKLRDFKDESKVKQWIGELHEFGETDLSVKQRKLINNNYEMSQKEFFDKEAFEEPSASFDKERGITVKLKIDHREGKIPKKIVKDAWPNAEIVIDDHQGNRRYKYQKEKGDITSDVWYRDKTEPQELTVPDYETYRELIEAREKLNPWDDDYGKVIEVPTKKIKNPFAGEPMDTPRQERELERIGAEWHETLREGYKYLPEKWKKQLKGRKLWTDSKNIKDLIRQQGPLLDAHTEKYRRKSQEQSLELLGKLDEKHSLKMNKQDAMLILAISSNYYENKEENYSKLIEVFNRYIKNGKIFDMIKDKIELSPINFSLYTVTFYIKSPEMLEEYGIHQGHVWMPMDIIVEGNKKISLVDLYKVAKKPTFEFKEGEKIEKPKFISKPRGKAGSTGQPLTAAGIKDYSPKAGFNEARNYLKNLIQNGIRELESSAPYLGG